MSKPVVEVVRLGRKGEIVLPRRVRSSLKLQEGDEIVLTIAENRMILERRARKFSAYLDAISTALGPKDED
jgi:AbrB family looped-hinge helix DNA binding protein